MTKNGTPCSAQNKELLVLVLFHLRIGIAFGFVESAMSIGRGISHSGYEFTANTIHGFGPKFFDTAFDDFSKKGHKNPICVCL